jgi:hypothetical protein
MNHRGTEDTEENQKIEEKPKTERGKSRKRRITNAMVSSWF